MRVIDADCHISSGKHDGLAITADDLLARMERASVDQALIWLKPPYNKDIAPENKAVYQAMKAHPNKFLGFGWTNPRLGHEAALKAIKQSFEEYGFYGIKFNGAQDDYIIDDEQLVMPLIEEAARYGKVIAFHIGADFYENTHPYRLGHIAKRFPETQFLMVHMGGAGTPALDRSAVETAGRCPNITLIGSAVPETAIIRAIKILGPDRLCFGSDTPFRLMHVQLAMYNALLEDFDQPTREKVLGRNLARLLGVQE
jgi:predicted TIM-barrel fold metal-dependent hydrolase